MQGTTITSRNTITSDRINISLFHPVFHLSFVLNIDFIKKLTAEN
jgi:hypothetical protein